MMLIFALLMQGAQPTPPMPRSPHGGDQTMVCPVGGERFQAWQATMYSTYGERPDGRPYSYLPFPLPVPECPTNGLVVFEKFSEADVRSLSKLIVTPAYAGPVGAETSYYRAAWLATRLGRPEPRSLGLLLTAIWQVAPGTVSAPQTPESRERLVRYQTEFVARAFALPTKTDVAARLWIESRAANAARQLGRFDTAETMRTRALATLGRVPDKRGWDTYLQRLGAVIARGDAGVEPLDMIPDRQIAAVCADGVAPSAFDRAICEKPAVAADVAALRARSENIRSAGSATRP